MKVARSVLRGLPLSDGRWLLDYYIILHMSFENREKLINANN